MTAGRTSQRKGARGEHELAAILTDLLGVECRKGSSPYLPGIFAPDIHIAGPLHVEVKRREKFSIPAAVRQSKHDAGPDQVPVVCHRPNRCGWMLTLELEDLPRFARAVAQFFNTERRLQ
jgi:hypothetical protein